jgi:hypothetical protein
MAKPKTAQITLRVDLRDLAKLDRFVEVAGGTRASLMRALVEEFAKKADALTELVESARKGAEAEAVSDWIHEILDGLSSDVEQMALPVRGRSGSSAA